MAAYHSGARIRWFEHDNSVSFKANEDSLVPLNSREIVRMERKSSALEYLALSVSNKGSLCFFSQSKDPGLNVLFSADSDLKMTARIPWSNGMIITAPHHGSESNASAYSRFQSETKGSVTPFWMRSDWRYRNRPGRSFLSVHGTKLCTLCRNRYPKKQEVVMVSNGGTWTAINIKSCTCK